ncbi:MAG: hypothetical protein U0353_34555 [Sandaracinus sp.]
MDAMTTISPAEEALEAAGLVFVAYLQGEDQEAPSRGETAVLPVDPESPRDHFLRRALGLGGSVGAVLVCGGEVVAAGGRPDALPGITEQASAAPRSQEHIDAVRAALAWRAVHELRAMGSLEQAARRLEELWVLTRRGMPEWAGVRDSLVLELVGEVATASSNARAELLRFRDSACDSVPRSTRASVDHLLLSIVLDDENESARWLAEAPDAVLQDPRFDATLMYRVAPWCAVHGRLEALVRARPDPRELAQSELLSLQEVERSEFRGPGEMTAVVELYRRRLGTFARAYVAAGDTDSARCLWEVLRGTVLEGRSDE